MAAKEQQLELQAHGLYLKIRSQNLQERSHGASGGLLGQLETLLSTPSLKESQLQVYSRLLRTNASIEAHQFDEAKRQLAEARRWADQTKNPLASAWVSAVSGDPTTPSSSPSSLGDYIDAQQQARGLQDPLFLGLLSNQIVNLYQEEQEPQKALQYANEAANYFHALGNPSLLSDALIVLARLNREQGEMNMALVYFFNALDLLDEGNNSTRIAHLKYEIGKTYLETGNLTLARTTSQRPASPTSWGRQGAADRHLLLLGELHLKQKEAGIAILQLENALALANQIGDAQRQFEIFRLLGGLRAEGLSAAGAGQLQEFPPTQRAGPPAAGRSGAGGDPRQLRPGGAGQQIRAAAAAEHQQASAGSLPLVERGDRSVADPVHLSVLHPLAQAAGRPSAGQTAGRGAAARATHRAGQLAATDEPLAAEMAKRQQNPSAGI